LKQARSKVNQAVESAAEAADSARAAKEYATELTTTKAAEAVATTTTTTEEPSTEATDTTLVPVPSAVAAAMQMGILNKAQYAAMEKDTNVMRQEVVRMQAEIIRLKELLRDARGETQPGEEKLDPKMTDVITNDTETKAKFLEINKMIDETNKEEIKSGTFSPSPLEEEAEMLGTPKKRPKRKSIPKIQTPPPPPPKEVKTVVVAEESAPVEDKPEVAAPKKKPRKKATPKKTPKAKAPPKKKPKAKAPAPVEEEKEETVVVAEKEPVVPVEDKPEVVEEKEQESIVAEEVVAEEKADEVTEDEYYDELENAVEIDFGDMEDLDEDDFSEFGDLGEMEEDDQLFEIEDAEDIEVVYTSDPVPETTEPEPTEPEPEGELEAEPVIASSGPIDNPWGKLAKSTIQRKPQAQLVDYLTERNIETKNEDGKIMKKALLADLILSME